MANIEVPNESHLIVAFDDQGNMLGVYDVLGGTVGNKWCPYGLANLYRIGRSGFVMWHPATGPPGADTDPPICYWVGDRMY